jgi:apolipoprotein N-acyltransferase
VVWPENSTAVDPFTDAHDHDAITIASQQLGAPILVGAMVNTAGGRTVANSGIVWEPDGSTEQRYVKHHPVPWGEYIPFRAQLGWLHFGDVFPARDMVRGTGTGPLDVGGVIVADAICFDIAHADVLTAQIRAGAEVVTVQTSNVTYRGSAQLRQQFDITRARAAESGRAIVVSSINGISGVIGPDGSSLQEAPLTDSASLEASLPRIASITPALRLGPWPARLAGLVLIAGVLATLRSRRRRRTVDSVEDTVPTRTTKAPGEDADE